MGGGFWRFLGFGVWVVLVLSGEVGCWGNESVVRVDGRSVVGVTDEDFVCATLDWWPPEKCDYGTCSWGLASMLNLNLSSPVLVNAVKAFSPLKIRLGGSLQDKVIYDVGDSNITCTPFVKNSSEMFGFTQGCLHMSRWDELNGFFKESGASIIFGLNALNGRVPMKDGSVGGPWDYRNADALIRYTVSKGYTIHGWELGNELSGNGVGTRIGAHQYAEDVIRLKFIVDNVYQGSSQKPLVLAPGGFFDAAWFKEFVDRTKPNMVNAITHHIYNLGPGVDTHLVEKILNPSYLDGEAKTFSDLQNILQNSATSATAWVGEAGGAYNSGHHLVTDAFIFSFWYLDQLAMSATYDTKTYCRQSLIGGNYGLLNTTTYAPNPDYYSALLWHKLMGRGVLSANFTGTKKIRAYAHCAKQSGGVTLLLINLDGNTTVRVTPSISPTTTTAELLRHHHRHRSTYFHGIQMAEKNKQFTREEYHLTPKGGDLHSQTMLLNGEVLDINENGEIPALEPMVVAASEEEAIDVAPYSIVFVHIPHSNVPACG